MHHIMSVDASSGTLAKFNLAVSQDGASCVLQFVDERHNAINCVTSFEDFKAFIASLMEAAAEMSRRLDDPALNEGAVDSLDTSYPTPSITVASAAFRMNQADGYMHGSLVGVGGEIVGLRLCPAMVGEMTRTMLLTAPCRVC